MAFRYRKFKVYQDALQFHHLAIELAKNFPKGYLHLENQLKRAALSVVLNIAEGSAKHSDKDFNRYVLNSLGSVNESIACSEVALMEKLLSPSQFNVFEQQGLEINNQLGGLSKKLKVGG